MSEQERRFNEASAQVPVLWHRYKAAYLKLAAEQAEPRPANRAVRVYSSLKSLAHEQAEKELPGMYTAYAKAERAVDMAIMAHSRAAVDNHNAQFVLVRFGKMASITPPKRLKHLEYER